MSRWSFAALPPPLKPGCRCSAIGGDYVLVGAVFPTRPAAILPEMIVRRLLRISGVHNYTPDDLATALGFLGEHHATFPFAELVTESFPLVEAEAAFKRAIESRALRIAVG